MKKTYISPTVIVSEVECKCIIAASMNLNLETETGTQYAPEQHGWFDFE